MPIDKAVVESQLEQILRSPGFSSAPKLQRFLRFVVHHTLAGHEEQIKESVIGSEVYQKSSGYDPRLDATVRVEAAKLRQRLQQYYEANPADPIRISIPKGTYVAHFESAAAAAAVPVVERPVAIDVPAQPVAPPEVPQAEPRTQWIWLFLAAAVGLAIVATLLVRDWPRSARPSPPPRLRQLTELGTYAAEPVIARDGTFVIYCSDIASPGITNLWRLDIDTGRSTQITQLRSPARTPTLSADGRTVAFRLDEAGGLLATMPATGGDIRRLASTARGRNPSLDPSGDWMAFWVPQDEQTLDNGSVHVADLRSEKSTPTRVFGAFVHAIRPIWDETGQHLAVLGTWQSAMAAREYDLWTARIEAGQLTQTPVKSGLMPRLLAQGIYRTVGERSRVEASDWHQGRVYFSAPNGDGGSLYQVALSSDQKVQGEPELLGAGAGRQTGLRLGAAQRMVFASALTAYDLHSLPLTEPADSLVRYPSGAGLNIRFSLDRAGRLATWERLVSYAPGRLWLEEIATQRSRDLGLNRPNRSYAVLSPDSRRVAYQVLENTRAAIYVEPATVSGAVPEPQRVCEDCGAPADWSVGGTHLAYVTGTRPSTIGLVAVANGSRRDIATHPSYGLFGPRLDMNAQGDGWMVLYGDNGPRTRQIFIAPLRSFRPLPPPQWIPVTDGAQWDLAPAWGPGGHSVYFVSHRDGHRCIWQQALAPGTRRPVGEAVAVRHFHSPAQTLMLSVPNRGVEALWVAGGRLYFSLENTSSSIWLRE